MNIYVDFDDCLCETARHFSTLVTDLFHKNVPYEAIRYFDLQKSFDLTKEQYEHMMVEAHKPEVLLAYKETPDASRTLNSFMDQGDTVSIITGRPGSAYEASRAWLDQHDLKRAKLYCLNKYRRDNFIKNSSYTLELEDYYKMHFDVAVEDSPLAFRYFDHLPDVNVMVFDRPWNHDLALPGENFHRSFSWSAIRDAVAPFQA